LQWNFRVYAKFREIPRKHGNSAATAKFRGSARNSAARGKLWALLIAYSDREREFTFANKVAVLTYKVLHGHDKQYLGLLIRADEQPHGRRTLRTTSSHRQSDCHFFLPDCLHGLLLAPFLLSYSVFDL